MKQDLHKLGRSLVILLLSYLGSVLIQFLGIYFFRAQLSTLLLKQLQTVIVMVAVLFFISNITYTLFAFLRKESVVAVNLLFVLIKIGVSLGYIYLISESKDTYYQTIIGVFLIQYAIHLIVEVALKKKLLE